MKPDLATPLRIGVIEDDPLLLDSLVERLEGSECGFSVALRARSCADYEAALPDLDLDALIVDLGLPDGDGTRLIRRTRQAHPEVDILVYTVFGDEKRVVGAIRAGATGYILKDDSTMEIAEAILVLRQGQAPISPGIARYLIERLVKSEGALKDNPLTDRQTQVLELAARGYTNKEIAGLLEISAHTVATYTKQIYEKLAVSSRNEAIFEATQMGILE